MYRKNIVLVHKKNGFSNLSYFVNSTATAFRNFYKIKNLIKIFMLTKLKKPQKKNFVKFLKYYKTILKK